MAWQGSAHELVGSRVRRRFVWTLVPGRGRNVEQAGVPLCFVSPEDAGFVWWQCQPRLHGCLGHDSGFAVASNATVRIGPFFVVGYLIRAWTDGLPSNGLVWQAARLLYGDRLPCRQPCDMGVAFLCRRVTHCTLPRPRDGESRNPRQRPTRSCVSTRKLTAKTVAAPSDATLA